MSELDDLLAREVAAGQLQSHGHFTLTREKALEKLAAFQLPDPLTWVLKVVQAAVRGGLHELEVRLSSNEAEFRLTGNCSCTLSDFEQCFYDPETSADPFLHCLKQALWSVGLHARRPFCLVLPGWPEGAFWNGDVLSRQPLQSISSSCRLTVSHRSRGDTGLPILRTVEAARCNAEILQELRQKAFVCPIPVRVDARRIDSVYLCPGHGLSKSSYPLQVAFLPSDLPVLPLPRQANEASYRDSELNRELEKLAPVLDSAAQDCTVVALLSAHVKEVSQGKSTVWKGYNHPCRIYWVLDGVVIDCRAFALADRSCSLGLIASAQGLTRDLSGFNLQVNAEYRMRLGAICRLTDSFVAQASVNFDEMVAKARSNGKWTGTALFLGGLGLAYFSPLHGVALTIGGILSYFNPASEEAAISEQIRRDLLNLQQAWPGTGNPAKF